MGVNTYLSIGNSDDRLTQQEWARFVMEVRDLIQRSHVQIHGEWFANPDQPWRNANWCIEVKPPAWWTVAQENPETAAVSNASGPARLQRDADMRQTRMRLKDGVRALCLRWRQDSFAWATAEVELVETGWKEDQTERRAYPELIERERAIQRHLDLAEMKRGENGARAIHDLMVQARSDGQRLRQQAVHEETHLQQHGLLFRDCPEKDCAQARRCTSMTCMVDHDAMQTRHVAHSLGNQGLAVIEQWGDLKPDWKRVLGVGPRVSPETPGEAVQEKSSEVDGHAE